MQSTELFHKENQIQMKLGSSDVCDIVIHDSSIDPYHLLIINTPDGNFKIFDQESTNGTYVQGQRISKTIVDREELIQVGSRPIDMRWICQHFEDEQEVTVSQAGTMIFSGSITPSQLYCGGEGWR